MKRLTFTFKPVPKSQTRTAFEVRIENTIKRAIGEIYISWENQNLSLVVREENAGLLTDKIVALFPEELEFKTTYRQAV